MNLLVDPVFRVETPDGREKMNLPQLLQALGEDRVQSLPGLQRHQEDAFHVFLCYLAGAVLAREGVGSPVEKEESWREGIRRLTAHDGCLNDDAWTLVVSDPTRPAFLQPPLFSKTLFQGFKAKARTPDELDILPTAKNHDVKAERAAKATPEEWILSLISLQTMAGFFGQGNYGISRMNGGFGSRFFCSLASGQEPGGRFRRDTECLLNLRQSMLAGPWQYREDGLALTWVEPWDLKTSLSLKQLDPFFIEVARAVRLIERGERLFAMGAPTKAARIAAKDAKGVLGDPWTPINREMESALTVGSAGLTPQLLRALVFEDGFELSPIQRPGRTSESNALYFLASVLVRGKGTTEGFHSVAIPIPPHAARFLFGGGRRRELLADMSKKALNDASTMQEHVLKPAFVALLESKLDRIGPWWEQAGQRFSDLWSLDYFPWLWKTAGQEDPAAARVEWLRSLRDKARDVLGDAAVRLPSREGRQYRARVHSDGLFYGTLFKNFPEMKEEAHGRSAS